MAHSDAGRAGVPGSSTPPLEGLGALVPVALAFLTSDSEHGYESIKRDVRAWAKEDPLDALVATVVGGGLAFYLAEREVNPACANPLDGILYIATCMSAGYDNRFPTTSVGHALATAAHSLGPALATTALDAPAAEAEAIAVAASAAASEAAAVNKAILARLEDIVRLLEAQQKP